jgi:hypothetical protein
MIKNKFKMNVEELNIKIESFSELQDNWDSYDADKITKQSIITAHVFLDSIHKKFDINIVSVFPMRNGGIQFDIGDKEIEILNNEIKEFYFDSENNIIHENCILL